MKKLILLLFVFPFLVFSQNQDQNYIKTTTYKKPTSQEQVDVNNPAHATISVGYFDGLGRPIQQVAHKQSHNGKDIVTHIEYDGFGRQTKEFMPFVSSTSPSLDIKPNEVMDFYGVNNLNLTGNLHFETTTNPFSEKSIEFSPLNRVLKQSAPGNAWVMGSGKEIKFEYQTNIENQDYVRIFEANANWNPGLSKFDISLVQNQGFYPTGELYKTITYDENTSNNPSEGLGSTVEFKDKLGRLVLKRLYNTIHNEVTRIDTYNVYDQYGNLTYVISPNVVTVNNDNTARTITVEDIDKLCYQHIYDYRNRLIEKKEPHKTWQYMVYDKLDRLVASGPANTPFLNQNHNNQPARGWLMTKYDVFNRSVLNAFVLNNTISSSERASLQSQYNNLVTFSEQKTTSITTKNGISFRYSDLATPSLMSNYHVLSVYYFDNYDTNLTFNPTIDFNANIFGQTVFYNDTLLKPKNLPTVSWVRIAENSSQYRFEASYTLYDDKSRPIRVFSKNHLGGYTQTDTEFNFVGQVIQTEQSHKRLNTSVAVIVTKDFFEYSPQGRLIKHRHQINDEPEEVLTENMYDELGNIIVQKIGGQNQFTSMPYQKVDFKRNIRGWLTEVNQVNNLLDSQAFHHDLFAFKLHYQTLDNNYPGQVLYNGNISQMIWKSLSDNSEKGYFYYFDELNRLTNANYKEPQHPAKDNQFNEHLTYDKNGNILTLNRTGSVHNYTSQIDYLNYQYDCNQLINVTDSPLGNDHFGFKDGNKKQQTNLDDYQYDEFGNMVIDRNKGISSIRYNHLNLATRIIFFEDSDKRIEYVYTADGRKVKKVVLGGTNTEGPTSESTTDYLGGYQYNNNILQFFPHAQGYVNHLVSGKDGSSLFDYVYQYKDHLGNIRINYTFDLSTSSLKVLEENHYYPFGLKHTNHLYTRKITEEKKIVDGVENWEKKIIQVPNSGYQYKYNSSEFQDELGLDMYAMDMRMYDPAIARWVVQDPVIHHNMSPYNAFDNNPVFWADPSGANSEPGEETDEDRREDVEEIEDMDEWLNRLFLRSNDGDVYVNSDNDDDITVDSNGKVTNVIRKEGANKFFDENGNELFFNDPKNTDKHMIYGRFYVGDIIFNQINNLLDRILVAGTISINVSQSHKSLLDYIKLGLKSWGEWDFPYALKTEYKVSDDEMNLAGYGVGTRTYFRFGNHNFVYNIYDAGQFMWGRALGHSGFSLSSGLKGTNVNERIFSGFKRGDSAEDVNAITNGFYFQYYNQKSRWEK